MLRVSAVVAGFLLVYLSAFNVILALNVETCTMGNAGSLMGGLISLPLYALGFAVLYAIRPKRLAFLAIVPIAIVAWLQLSFAIRLTIGYLLNGMSACEVMFGMDWEMDGREAFFAMLWLALNVVFIGGLVLSFWRAPARRQFHP